MTAPTLDLTQTAIFTAFGDFLASLVPTGVDVVQGQVNRVPTVTGPDYMVFWPLRRDRLATNETSYSPFPAYDHRADKERLRITIQVDVHGPNSADYVTILSTMMRSDIATQFFDDTGLALQILYADEARQLAFTTAEDQWEDRWSIECVLQANPVTTTVQQFADEVKVGLIEVDTTYPAGDA